MEHKRIHSDNGDVHYWIQRNKDSAARCIVFTHTITHLEGKINISETNRPETEKWCNSADEVLEYMVGNDRLRDVITKVTVIDRTI